MKKKGRRWLAMILAVALVSSNALYQLGTQMSASESESGQQTTGAEGTSQTQETTVDTATQQDQSQGDQAVQVQEVPSSESGQATDAQQNVASDAGQQTGEQTEAAVEKTVDVKIQKPDTDGGQITAWGVDGNKAEVTYDDNNQYVKTVKEGETFNFEITVKDSYKVTKVADQNGTEIQPKAVNGSVYTYEVTNITAERIFNITYNKEETDTSSKDDQKKSDDEKSDDADDEGDSAKAKTQAQSNTKAAAQSTDDIKNVKIGKTITLTGTESKYPISWTSSDSNVATVTGNKNKGTVKGVAGGVVTITYKYWSWNNEAWDWEEKTETWTVSVGTLEKLTKVKISGDSTVKAFEKIQLSASVEPADAAATYTWESSDTSVLSVDANGKVTTYKPGKATVTVRATGYDKNQTTVSAAKEITVEAATTSDAEALFYYLISPTADPDSNESSEWGPSLGTGTITTQNATWINNKNTFENVESRVISWPTANGTLVNGRYELTRESSDWNTIFNNYQSQIASKYPGQTITKDDVEAIILHPYKISRNNSSNPDKHVDCTVEIKVKNFYTATYKVQDANTVGYVWKEGDTYREGEETSPQGNYPTEKTVNGVKYTFSGWYDNESLSGSPITFPYTMRENVTFYAKYVAGYNVTYELDGGTWNKAQNTEHYQVGNTVYVTNSVPEKSGYTFEGWTYSEDDSKTYQSNDHFEMPEKNVTLTAKWKEKPGKVGYNLVLKDAEWNADVSSYLESNGLSQGGAQKYVEKTRYAKGDKFTVTSDEPVADGYAFVGWFDKDRSNSDGDSATVRSAGEKVTYIYKNDTYTLDALWVGINAEGETVTYDGKPHTITNETGFTQGTLDDKYVQDATGNVEYGTVYYSKDGGKTWTTKKPSFVDAGEYTVLVKQEVTVGEKKTELKASAVVTINKRTVTLTSADDNKTYDGTPLTNSKVTVGGDKFADGEGATYDVTGSQTEVGTSKNTFSYTPKNGTNPDNYTITKEEGTLEVTPVTEKVVVTITGNTGGEKYTGKEQTVSGYKVSIDNKLYKKAYFKFTGTAEVKGTNAGNYPMGLTASDFANVSKNFTNVEFVVTDGALDIAKRDVTLTSATDSKPYDGTPLTNNGITVDGDGFVEGEGVAYNVTGSQTDEGTSDNTFTYELNKGTNKDNYNITQVTGKLTVKADENEVVVTITGNTKSEKYSGKEQTVTDYTVSIDSKTYTKKDFSFKGTAEAKGTDVGTYKMGLKASDFVNNNKNFKKVTFVVKDGTLEITKRDVTLTSGSSSRSYTGSALTNENVTVSGDGFVKGEGATYDVTGTITDVGTIDNDFTYTLDKGTKKENYNISTVPGELEITPVDEEVVVTIQGNTDSKPYNGIEQKVTDYKVVSISNTLYTSENVGLKDGVLAEAKGTNAGTYAMGLTADGFINNSKNFTNVRFEVTDGSLKIAKRNVTLTSADDSKPYDGNPLTNKNVTVGGDGFVNGQGASYDVIGTITNVGTTENTFSYTLNEGTDAGNYNITTDNGTLEVMPVTAKVTVTIKGNTDSQKYTGKEQNVTGYDVKEISNPLYTKDDFTFSGEATAKGTNAGTYPMGLTASDFANVSKNFTNVEFKVEDGSLTIAKRDVTLTSADDSKPYDGKALTNDTITVGGDGFVEGEGATYNVTGSQTKVGSSDNKFTYTPNAGTSKDNYNITKVEGKLTVTADDKEVVVTITGKNKTEKYSGTEQTVTDYTVTSSNPLYTENDFTFSGKAEAKGTDAGTYKMGLKESDFKNTSDKFSKVKFVVEDGTLTITKRNVTLTSGSSSRPYTGEVLTNNTITVSGDGFVNGEGASCKVTGSQTDVGSSKNKFTYTLDEGTNKDNYEIKTKEGTLEVTPVTSEVVVKITGNHTKDRYDGTAKKASGYVIASISNPLYKDSDFTFNGKALVSRTDAGKTEMGLDAKNFKNENANFTNVKFEVTDGYVEVEKRTVTMTSATDSRAYNGKALTNKNVTESDDGFAKGEGATYKVTGSQTVVGSSDNTFTYELKSNTNPDNYTIITKEGTLTITNREAKYEITVKAKRDKVPYDGKDHSVTGLETTTFTVDGETYTVEGLTTEDPTQKDAGTYTNNITGTPVVKDAAGNDVSSEFTVNTENGKLVIEKAKVTLKSADLDKVYNGTALVNGNTPLATESGFAEGESTGYTFTGSQTEVGESKNAFTVNWDRNAKESNYDVTIEFGTLKVTEQSIVPGPDPENPDPSYKGIQINNPSDVPYNGQVQKWTPTVTDATGKVLTEGTDYTVSYDKDDFTNVTGVIKVTITGKGNYTGSVTKNYQILPREYTVETDGDSKTYDGEPLTAAGYKVENVLEKDGYSFRTTGSQTEVGESDNTYTLTWNDEVSKNNYKLAGETLGKLVVTETKDSIVAVVTGGSHTYDGNPHGAKVTVTGLPKGYSVKTAKSNTSLTDVSKATAKVDELVIVNANGEDVTAKLNIDKSSTAEVEVTPATLTITTPDASRVYDGNALTAAGTIDGFVNKETATFKTTGSQTEVGESKNTYTLTWDGTAKESNYTISESVGTLKVTEQSIVPGPDPENPDPNYKGIQINDPSDVPYDGETHKWTPVVTDKDGKILTEGTDYEVSYSKTDYTNVTGAIEVTITGKGNYTGSAVKSYQILPREYTVTTDGDSKTYDGEPLTAAGYEVKNVLEKDGYSFRTTGSQTEVGESDNTYTLTWNDEVSKNNYKLAGETLGKLVVTETKDSIVAVVTGGRHTYDGNPYGAKVTVTGLPKGYSVKTAKSNTSLTDVSKATAKVDELVIVNAKGEDVTSKLNIDKSSTAEVEVTPATLTISTPDANKVYDGTALTAAGKIEGFVNNETATFKTTGSQTEVGDSKNTYTLTWDGTAKESNYTISESVGTLKVTEQSIVPKPDPENPDKPDPNYKGITINDPSDVPYDGTEHKWTPVVKDKDGNKLEEGKDYEVSYNDKDDFTNVTGEITVTITGKGNYSGTVDKVYKITPREVTITTDSATRVFNNEALTAPGRVEGIVAGETYGFEVTGSQTYVGKSVNSYEMTWAAEGKNEYTAKKSNYNVTVNTGLLTVTDGTPETPVDPSLVVNKTHNTDKTYKVGDVITFTITVKNIYDEAKIITLEEQEGVTLDKTTFENVKPGEEIKAKATYTVTEADIIKGTFTNTVKATFSGVDKDYKGTDTVDKFEKSNPHMTITKTTKDVKEDHIYKLGETIKYVITVTNDGNLTLTNVKIEDALTGNAGDNAWTIETLAPGDTKTFEASYTVTEADVLAGKVVNNATGKAENPDPKKPETPVTPGEKEDPVETPNPNLTVIKTADKTGEVKLGEKIKYTITVTNNGNVTISGVKLNDSLTGENWELGDIKPGKTVTKETTYTVTEEDIIAGQVKNLATAEGKDPNGKDIKGEGEKTVTTEDSNPQITVTKKTTSKPANGETYALGEKITYEITAENTGNLTLTDVKVSDKLTGNTGDKAFKIDGEFKPGDKATFEVSYTVKESDLGKTVVNVATATGTTPDPKKPEPDVKPGETEDPTDSKKPALSITKKVVGEKKEYQIGDTVTYEITVENTGNTTQNNILVEDQMKAAGAAKITKVENAKGTIDGANVTLDTLAPGKTATITAEYTVVKEDRGNTITNAAVAKGEGENPETPEVPVDVEDVYDIHVEHVFADGEEGDVALPDNYDIENLKPGTSKILEAEAVEGYVAYPSTKTVTIENEDVTVTFIYYKDTIGTDPTNPDQPDNIPDRYQVVVRFEAVNGTVTHDHAVVTLFDENNEPAVNGIGHLSFFQIAGARANAGYEQSSLNWSPVTPTTSYEITGEMTFTARFTATSVTPQDNPQTPSNPVNPQTPSNPGVINRVVDTITNAPQAASNAVRNFVADVKEVLNSDDGSVPLANQKLDDHDCCILHFLIMLITAILYGFFTHNMKKRQKKNFELREELDTELAKRGLPTSREQEAN